MTVDEFLGLIDSEGNAPPGVAAVAAFEAEFRLQLPDDYRAFLAATPGGRVRGNVNFSLAGEEDGQEIMGVVFGLCRSDSYALSERLADAEEDAIPQGLIPIMKDRGGNIIALVVPPDRAGTIVFLDHEVGEEGRATLEAAESDDWCYAIPFAASFTAMIAGFKVSRD